MRHANIAVVVLIGLNGIQLRADEPNVSASDFAKVVAAEFKKWDRNNDGQIDKAELEAQIADSRVTGKQAAALAAIAGYQCRPGEKRKTLPLDFFLREAMKPTAREVEPPFEVRYRDALFRIENVSRVLFGPGAPSALQVQQGHIGDCFFVAIVGAVAERNPESIRRWIDPQPDKSANVRFPLGAQATVRTLTDAEIALTSFAGKQGMWINVLEKAFGSVMETAFPNPNLGDPLEAIAFGGSPIQTIRLMTGHDCLAIALRTPEQKPLDSARINSLTPQVRAILEDCHNNKRVACAGSPRSDNPPGLTPQHAFAVLGFDQKTGVVQLWNPHSNQFQPAAESSLKNGYKTQHGRFEMSLADFMQVFYFLAYESAANSSP
jgi:hypothetical protein